MKQLFTNAATSLIIKPREVFINLYLDGGVSGGMHDILVDARQQRWRKGDMGGITIRVARDEHGDFIIEKVEEF
jgi:hypothetical protein